MWAGVRRGCGFVGEEWTRELWLMAAVGSTCMLLGGQRCWCLWLPGAGRDSRLRSVGNDEREQTLNQLLTGAGGGGAECVLP